MKPKMMSDFKEEGFTLSTSVGASVAGFLADEHQDILFIFKNTRGDVKEIILSTEAVVIMGNILAEFAALGRITGKTSPE